MDIWTRILAWNEDERWEHRHEICDAVRSVEAGNYPDNKVTKALASLVPFVKRIKSVPNEQLRAEYAAWKAAQ